MGRSRTFAALAFIIFGFFTIIVSILMLNVLVAMFNKCVSTFFFIPPHILIHAFLLSQHIRTHICARSIRACIFPHETCR